jgi:hypothetical protein
VTEVVSLHSNPTNAGKPNQEIVDIIERLLARAKRGEIASFAWALVEPGNYFGTGFHFGGRPNTELSGVVAGLQYRICQMVLGDREPNGNKEP